MNARSSAVPRVPINSTTVPCRSSGNRLLLSSFTIGLSSAAMAAALVMGTQIAHARTKARMPGMIALELHLPARAAYPHRFWDALSRLEFQSLGRSLSFRTPVERLCGLVQRVLEIIVLPVQK